MYKMVVEKRKRICCNCGHCLRIKDDRGIGKHNQCGIDSHYIGYIETFDGWCNRWCKEHKFD